MRGDEISLDLGELHEPVMARLRALGEQGVVRRIWEKDHTVWRDDPTEIEDRLGWLDAVERSRRELPAIRTLVTQVRAAGLSRTLLLGMGGSSLAPEVLRRTFFTPEYPPAFDLTVLDTTHPDALARLETEGLERTLFVVSSKSGTTIETRSHMAYFRDRFDAGQFVAVTDPGSSLESDASEQGFRRVVRAPSDVGGRYSALTVFGLLPAALMGVDPELLLVEAAGAVASCLPEVPLERNPAAVLGAVMGEAALGGRDKLTLVGSPEAAPFGAWVEQLVAESTGKQGRGILPVADEPPSQRYGDDRLFLAIGGETGRAPSVTLPFHRPADLGRLFFVFEMATAIAGAILDIHPFDQPDVQEAKDRTAEALEGERGEVEGDGDLDELLASVGPGDYLALLAFCDPSTERWDELQGVRARILERTGAATTLGFGPRYLHSTGQLHKGGPDTGVFVQVVQEPAQDREIPGRGFTFGRLLRAQADGDLQALRARGRRAIRVPLDVLRGQAADT